MTLQELGQIIREHREISGLSIEEIAGRIKVSARILRSIENGSMEGLPHVVYTKSFVRAFATMVGVEQNLLNDAVAKIFSAEACADVKVDSGFKACPPPPSNLGKGLAFVFCLILLLVGLATGGWYIFTEYGDTMLQYVKQPFSSGVPASNSSNRTTSREATPLDMAPLASLLAPHEGAAPANEIPSRNDVPVASSVSPSPSVSSPSGATALLLATPSAAEPVSPREARAAPQVEPVAQHVVVVKSRGPCWIGFKVDGVSKHYTTQTNEPFTITFDKSFEAVFGNPSVVEVTYNGNPYKLEFRPRESAKLVLP